MIRDLPVVVNELLRYRVASEKATEWFREQKHNVDLCPRVRSQLELLLESYVKYDAVAYDVQGIHDQGTDVLLKFYPEGDGASGPWAVIAFQVKSFDDLKKKDYLKDLRSQRLQAEDEYGERLTQYVILLCTDEVYHRDRIREVAKAFSKIDRTLVVLPSYSFNFLRLRRTHVNLVVDTFEKSDDIVLERAQSEVTGLSPTRAAVLLSLVYHALHHGASLTLDALQGDVFLKEIYRSVPDGDLVAMLDEDDEHDHPMEFSSPGEVPQARSFAQRLAEDVDALGGNVVQGGLLNDTISVDIGMCRPLQALLLDLEVRYEVSGAALLEHVFGLLGVMKRFGLEYGEAVWEDS